MKYGKQNLTNAKSIRDGHSELAGFDRRLVFYDAVFGNAEAVEACTQGTELSHDDTIGPLVTRSQFETSCADLERVNCGKP
jgi:hypothetical protein